MLSFKTRPCSQWLPHFSVRISNSSTLVIYQWQNIHSACNMEAELIIWGYITFSWIMSCHVLISYLLSLFLTSLQVVKMHVGYFSKTTSLFSWASLAESCVMESPASKICRLFGVRRPLCLLSQLTCFFPSNSGTIIHHLHLGPPWSCIAWYLLYNPDSQPPFLCAGNVFLFVE